MTRPPEENLNSLDTLLGQHVRQQLDPQRGRAAQAFRAYLAQKAPPRTLRIRPFLIMAIPLAAAACAVFAWSPLTHITPPVAAPTAVPAQNVATVNPKSENPPLLDDVTLTRNVDGGTIVFDNTPARVVVEQQLRHTQWFDPANNATMTVTQPKQNVKLVALEPY